SGRARSPLRAANAKPEPLWPLGAPSRRAAKDRAPCQREAPGVGARKVRPPFGLGIGRRDGRSPPCQVNKERSDAPKHKYHYGQQAENAPVHSRRHRRVRLPVTRGAGPERVGLEGESDCEAGQPEQSVPPSGDLRYGLAIPSLTA